MADEVETLVQNEVPEDNVIAVGNREPRTLTCNRSNVMPFLSIFVALLLAGQAVSVYFITQQQGRIQALDDTTKQMKLNDMIKKLPGIPSGQHRQKLRMATFNAPLALRDDDGKQELLEQEAMMSNSIEDAARYMLLMANPLRKYPSFNETILDNLRKLRRTLSYEEWMLFDSWMHQWYLFYLVQNSNVPEPTPGPSNDVTGAIATGNEWRREELKEEVTGTNVPQERNPPFEFGRRSGNLVYASASSSSDSFPSFIDETPSGAPLMTPCQIKAQAHAWPGTYLPQCDENGDYKPMQCWMSTGFCWCVYRNGTEIPQTKTRAKLDCSVINEPMDEMFEYETSLLDDM